MKYSIIKSITVQLFQTLHAREKKNRQTEHTKGPMSIFRVPYPVSRIPYPVSRIPCPVSRVPRSVSRVQTTLRMILIAKQQYLTYFKKNWFIRVFSNFFLFFFFFAQFSFLNYEMFLGWFVCFSTDFLYSFPQSK